MREIKKVGEVSNKPARAIWRGEAGHRGNQY